MTSQQYDLKSNRNDPQTQLVETTLIERGYKYIPQMHFNVATYIEQPIYSTRYHIGSSIYNTTKYCDFILYHPAKWPKNLIIESNWQQSSGTVDEKFPFLVLNITLEYSFPTIVLCDGGGYREGAMEWLRSQSGNGNFLYVFNMHEFTAWVNKENI